LLLISFNPCNYSVSCFTRLSLASLCARSAVTSSAGRGELPAALGIGPPGIPERSNLVFGVCTVDPLPTRSPLVFPPSFSSSRSNKSNSSRPSLTLHIQTWPRRGPHTMLLFCRQSTACASRRSPPKPVTSPRPCASSTPPCSSAFFSPPCTSASGPNFSHAKSPSALACLANLFSPSPACTCFTSSRHYRHARRRRSLFPRPPYSWPRRNHGLYWHFVDLVWMFVVPLVYFMHLAEERRSLFLLMRNMIWSYSFRLLRMDSFPQ
jgi:hypothetical protein